MKLIQRESRSNTFGKVLLLVALVLLYAFAGELSQ